MPSNLSRTIKLRISEADIQAMTQAVKAHESLILSDPSSGIRDRKRHRTLEGLWRRIQGNFYAALDGEDFR